MSQSNTALFRFLRLLFVLSCLCGSHILAEDAPPGEKLAELQRAAENGVAVAQYNLAICYGNGEGVPVNPEIAAKWFRAAADQGHADAQAAVSRCYEEGLGVKIDEAESLKWLQKAANQGHAMSQFNLAALYAEGLGGVAKNDEEALKWIRKAAEQGEGTGQYVLGVRYFAGKGVKKDLVSAYMWLDLSKKSGFSKAGEALDLVSPKMTAGQITEAKLLSKNWKPNEQVDVP